MLNFLSILAYEWKKNFARVSILGAVFLLSMINLGNIYYGYSSNSYFADNNGWKNAYWELYNRFSGTITSEKLADLKELYVPLAQKAADMTFNTAIDSDSITGINGYSDYLMLDSYYVADMQMFCGYAANAEEIAMKAKENTELYHALGNAYQARVNVKIYDLFHNRRITSFAYTEGYKRMTEYTFSSWLVLLICLFAVSGIFAGEKEIQMDKLLRSAQKGYYATAYAKIVAALLFAAVVSAWFSFMDYCGFASVYGFKGAGSLPVYALADFKYSILDTTLLQYFLLASAGRILGMVFFALLCTLLSTMFRTSLLPFLLGCVLSGTACLLAVMTQNACCIYWKVCNPAFWLYSKALYGGTEYVNVLGEPVTVSMAAFCCCLLLCVILSISICHVYCRIGLMKSCRIGGKYAGISV